MKRDSILLRVSTAAVIAGVLVMTLLISPRSVLGEGGTVSAAAPWKGRSFLFPVGPDTMFLVGVYSGVFYVDDGKGALHSASIVCPSTAEGSLDKHTRTGQGRCILTDENGNRIYARFECSGDFESCRGPFTIIGGTGRFAGITGEGEMISRMEVSHYSPIEGYVSAEQQGEGVALWPRLTYTIPPDSPP